MRYPLACSTWDEAEIEAGCRVLRSGWTTMGEECAKFELAFADYIGTTHAVMVNSGGSANLLMIAALVYSGRLPRGSTVAVPAVSWSTTYAPLEQFGMRVVMVDVDDTFCIDPEQIPYCDAVFGVNLLGNACDDRRISAPIVLEDNCEALGAEYEDFRTGGFGLMGSHSLFFSHHITTMEGGVITTDDDGLWRMLLMLRAHGWTRHLPEYEPTFQSYEFQVPGYSMRPTEVQGAIGIEQMKKLPRLLDERRENAEHYKRLIGHMRPVGDPSWFWFPVLTPRRDALIEAAREDFEVRPIVAGNIMRQPMMQHFDVQAGDLPMADRIHDEGLAFGNVGREGVEAMARLIEQVESARAA